MEEKQETIEIKFRMEIQIIMKKVKIRNNRNTEST
jgi:hypothetical protein